MFGRYFEKEPRLTKRVLFPGFAGWIDLPHDAKWIESDEAEVVSFLFGKRSEIVIRLKAFSVQFEDVGEELNLAEQEAIEGTVGKPIDFDGKRISHFPPEKDDGSESITYVVAQNNQYAIVTFTYPVSFIGNRSLAGAPSFMEIVKTTALASTVSLSSLFAADGEPMPINNISHTTAATDQEIESFKTARLNGKNIASLYGFDYPPSPETLSTLFAGWKNAHPAINIEDGLEHALALGLGDYLITCVPELHWAIIEDEYGRDFAIVGKKADGGIFLLFLASAIEKRIANFDADFFDDVKGVIPTEFNFNCP